MSLDIRILTLAALVVKLRPGCSSNLVAAGSSQDQDFQRSCRDALTLSQLKDEGGDFAMGEGGMVFNARDLARLRQNFVEMAFPPCRILTFPETVHCCPIQDALDPTT